MPVTDCIFCKIVARSLPSHVIYEDEHLLAFLDIHPVRPGHTQIVPKVHYAFFDELPPELMARIGNVASDSSNSAICNSAWRRRPSLWVRSA